MKGKKKLQIDRILPVILAVAVSILLIQLQKIENANVVLQQELEEQKSELTYYIEKTTENKETIENLMQQNENTKRQLNEISSRSLTEKREVKEVKETKNTETWIATAYCNCEKCCGKWSKYNKTASGTTPMQGRTIAVDKSLIPLGTTVYINGQPYIAEDTGSAIKGKIIDIYFDSHNDAKNFGRQKVEVNW